MKNKIGVIIVTSLNRNDVLFSRSLKSVLTQKLLPDYILIVDDNEEYKVSHEIECKLDEIKIKYKFPQIYYVKNIHTKGMSGTGGWNTGFEWYEKKFTYRDYIAILDDDDRWQEDYLKKCYEKIIECEPDQIIAFLKRTDLSLPCRFNIEDLCIKNFLKGNPGVQGSNMFFKFGAIKLIGGFDESLASCTDRDFMIKVLTKMPNLTVKIIDEVLVEHFAEKSSITYDLIKKEKGLDAFYKKHISLFTRNILEDSLRRSEELFEYKNCDNIRKLWELKHKKNEEVKIVIGVALYNNQATIRNTITSILAQRGVKRNVWILIVDDDSSDNWKEKISDLLENDRILYWKVKYRNVSKVRNFINSFIKEYFDNVLLIGRLDSDDIYSENTVLSRIEQLKEETNADYIIAGNYVQLNGERQENRASSKLLNNLYLLDLLKNMSLGRAKNELPSCNIFMTPQKICEYPEKESAEDHFLVAKVLLNREKNKVVIAENLFLTVYNLNGCVTNSNKKKEIYYYAREELYMDVLEDIKNEYKNKVMDILNNNIEGNLEYIGHGKEGFVFHDNKWVYKVLDFSSSKTEKSCVMNRLCFFLRREKRKYKSFYEIEELIEVKEGVFIEKYLYEESEEVMQFTEKDIVQLLVECWQKKVIILDCKKENFIRVNGDLKLIDMDACTAYMDNFFINECARLFIYLHYQDVPNLKKIQRSIINNFDLPELKGFEKFVNKIFVNIIYAESEEIRNRMLIKKNNDFIYEVYSVNTLPNLNKIFYEKIRENLYLADVQISDIFLSEKNTFVTNSIYVGYKKLEKCDDKVSLLIKTCAMDVATIEQNIKHIVKQLSSPKTFYEIVVSIDSKKENFIREYTKDSDYEKVIEIVKRLVNEKVIDRYIIFNPEEAVNINKRWFNIETEKTHSVTNVPISSQLYAFEQCMGDYILQMDSDVMIGRKDLNHDFLADMISELKKNEKVISVGFNICNPESKLYFGFENGGFVPEVRMGLFYKKRFFDLRPFPNSINEKKKLELTWYRSVEKYQKDTGYSSIRGGDNRSFFIHPQNYRKTQQHTWMNILDRIEQLEIPKCQLEHFDCEGSFYDWNIPKRNEKLIIIAYVRNVTTSQFLRFWLSIMSQNLEEIGIIIYDNCSDNGISVLIEKIVKPYKDKITYIRGRNILPKIQCEHIAIKQFCENQQSIIICIDGKNAFIGNNVLEAISECYENNMVDATCGIEYENNAIQVNYRKAVDFVRPRNENTNVGKGIISFRKYLFDSIPLDHFMYEGKNLKLSERKWLEGCEEIIKMIPIIEMSAKPTQLDFINLYVDKISSSDSDVSKILKSVENKECFIENNIVNERKIFRTNKNRIDIDITYLCNLKCKGCIRSCGEAPSFECMTVQDIDDFIAESIRQEKKWERINILGGEPTLHPDFLKIIEHLQYGYSDVFNKDVVIQIVSNGKTDESRKLCKIVAEKFSNVKINNNSYKKENKIDFFTPFCDAPIDDEKFKNADFSKACWVASDSGFGLNNNGYFACPNCAGIDRVMKSNLGLKSFKDLTDENQKKQFNAFCKYCGFFKYYDSNLGNFIPREERPPFKDIISKSWKEIYEKYNKQK